MVETSEKFKAALIEFNKSMLEEIERQTKDQEEKIEEYIELQSRIKAKSAVVTRELTEMAKIFRAFEKKYEVGGRTVFTKTLKFYLDALSQFDLQKIKDGLEEEVRLMKSEMDEMTKIKVEKIKNIYEVSSNPDKHLKMMKEASDKYLAQSELLDQEKAASDKQLQAAEAE